MVCWFWRGGEIGDVDSLPVPGAGEESERPRSGLESGWFFTLDVRSHPNERKVAEKGVVLTEAQVAALDQKRDDEECG